MTLSNLRKWMPSYKKCKSIIDESKEAGNSEAMAYFNMNRNLWSTFTVAITFGFYDRIVDDYEIVLRALIHYLQEQYKEAT